jgi:sugar phosphate isomerase/epimerase
MMYLTGFADEAGGSIEAQIAATKKLGWEHIESRSIDGTNIHDLSDADFDVVYGKLEEAGVKINCFGSAIANWGKHIEEPMDSSVAEVRRAIPRMKRLGCEMARIMSFRMIEGRGPEDQMKEERFKRLREITKMFTDEGLLPVHENCMNFGGMGGTYSLEMLENVPGLKLVFDTGNPIFTYDYAKGEPYPKQSAWEFYDLVRDHVAYVHIKDGTYVEETGGTFAKADYSWAGEGDGDVKRIVADLVQHGYDGGFSMEPHLSVVFHEEDGGCKADVQFNNYVEYGRRFEAMLSEIQGG